VACAGQPAPDRAEHIAIVLVGDDRIRPCPAQIGDQAPGGAQLARNSARWLPQDEVGIRILIVDRRLAVHEDGAHLMAARAQAFAHHVGDALSASRFRLSLDLNDLHDIPRAIVPACSRGQPPIRPHTEGSMPMVRRQIRTPITPAVAVVPARPNATPSSPNCRVSRAVTVSPTMLTATMSFIRWFCSPVSCIKRSVGPHAEAIVAPIPKITSTAC